jgi:hypothetical protein
MPKSEGYPQGLESINKTYEIGVIITVIWPVDKKMMDSKYPIDPSKLDIEYPTAKRLS